MIENHFGFFSSEVKVITPLRELWSRIPNDFEGQLPISTEMSHLAHDS